MIYFIYFQALAKIFDLRPILRILVGDILTGKIHCSLGFAQRDLWQLQRQLNYSNSLTLWQRWQSFTNWETAHWTFEQHIKKYKGVNLKLLSFSKMELLEVQFNRKFSGKKLWFAWKETYDFAPADVHPRHWPFQNWSAFEGLGPPSFLPVLRLAWYFRMLLTLCDDNFDIYNYNIMGQVANCLSF